jgi:hypothetical protein
MSSVNIHEETGHIVITRVKWQDDSLANLCISLDKSKQENVLLTPDSPDNAIVRERIPLHVSKNLISWS